MHLTCIQGQTYFKNLRHLPVCIASKTGKYGKIMPKITRDIFRRFIYFDFQNVRKNENII